MDIHGRLNLFFFFLSVTFLGVPAITILCVSENETAYY